MTFNKDTLLGYIDRGEKLCDWITSYLAEKSEKDGRVSVKLLDQHQVLAVDLVWMKSILLSAREIIKYGACQDKDQEQRLASFYTADILSECTARISPHFSRIGIPADLLNETIWGDDIAKFIGETLNPEFYEPIADALLENNNFGNPGLSEDQKMIADTFRKYAEDKVMPVAEHVHREDQTIPEDIIQGLKELGCFGLSIPQRYGGFQDDAKEDNMGMVIVTEELSRGSVGVAGSLITRPEILSKAILKGGTEEQKQTLLPQLAMGEKMCAVAVTEPDFGSDVAGMSVQATKTEGGWLINGVKTWCTFAAYADYLLVLVRTNPDKSLGHKGLTIMIAEKPKSREHSFSYDQPEGGHIEGKAIATIGYRGMHSYEVSFQDYFVPDAMVVGGEEGLGKGFYLQMAGFAGGRLQTAARANGVMQAALEKAISYCNERSVFNTVIGNYQLSKYKLAKMAAIIQASRQVTYHSARLMDEGEGMMEASLVKLYTSKIAEWVTREAMQLHGGMGYAEEYAVSRYFVDARVFSIFEGAEDVLALRVCARSLVDEKIKNK
jgi:(2S)-methylsuccinyl-CoA dehydrogenase